MKSIFEKKGVNGVLEEIDLLGGDYARRLYFVALDRRRALRLERRPAGAGARSAQRMTLRLRSPPGAASTSRRASRSISAGAAAYVQAMATMKSDYDQRQALDGADASATAPASTATRWSPARRPHESRATTSAWCSIERSAAASLSVDVEAERARRRRGMQSDYDRGQVLTAYVQRYGVEPAVREPFFAAVQRDQVRLRAAPGADRALRRRMAATARSSRPRSTPCRRCRRTTTERKSCWRSCRRRASTPRAGRRSSRPPSGSSRRTTRIACSPRWSGPNGDSCGS